MAKGKRQPVVKGGKSNDRKPAVESEPNWPDRPLWAFNIVDLQGPWCCSGFAEPSLLDVLAKLKNLESMTWNEIGFQGSHPIPIGDLIKAAQDRLVEIKQDDVDELYSLRLTGKRRVWGIKDRNVLRILWWDPEHEICPSPKKHT